MSTSFRSKNFPALASRCETATQEEAEVRDGDSGLCCDASMNQHNLDCHLFGEAKQRI